MNQRWNPTLRRAARALAVVSGLWLLAACTNPFQPDPVTWEVEPDTLLFRGAAGVTAPTASFVLRNAGRSAADFRVEPSSDWILVEPKTGRLAPGASATLRVGVSGCTDAELRAGLIAVSGPGARATVRVVHECASDNAPPTAVLTASPQQGAAPLRVDFSVESSDPDGDLLDCELDFGDGTAPARVCSGETAHSYLEPGGYTAVLTVSDGTTSTQATRTIAVGAADAPTWVAEPTRLTFDAVVGGTAPDPQNLRLRNAGGAAGSFTATADSAWLTVSPSAGTLDPAAETLLAVRAAACEAAGRTSARLTLAGGGAQTEVTVVRNCASPQNRPPAAALAADPTTGAPPLTVRFTTSATDPDGDALTCSLDFGDGSSAALDCGTAVGHTYAAAGRYTAVLTVRDGQGGTARAEQTVEAAAPNQAPSATISVDPDSGTAPLNVTFALTSSDPDGDPLTCSLDFGDGQSLARCSGSVAHSYDQPGTYRAVFSVEDGRGGRASAEALVRVAAPANPGAFDIQILFVEEPADPDVRAAFENAAARWEQVLTGDLRDVQANVSAGSCLDSNPGYQGTIDDLLIVADVVPIDGAYGILGSAGPCYVRGDAGQADYYLPYFGIMKFDSADLDRMKQNGTLEVVILHEMGHVLGLGTLWEAGPFAFLNHNAASCQDASDVTYDGPAAMDAWHALGAVGEVHVENTGGAGTKCGHWREATFDTELMTGWIDGAVAPLSRVTVGSLDDLGYAVNYAAADGYALPSGDLAQLAGGERLEEVLILPQPPTP
ncbi:PKD domain-containing protein [Oceanithermus sp.]|uniref:PKD domain-containing protein n=1 Tax=Oceanithermus sp. TaxID=2268145 RepID=UPI00257D69B1|nr:PKD domain-containing protein [Oceanithermus sp.]